MIVYDKEQKEIVIPNGIGNINLFNNGVEAGYNQGYEQGQADMAGKARVLNVTENGVYKSKYSDPIMPTSVTGVYADGTEFYNYAELNGKVFNTKIAATENSRLEFWYKGDNKKSGDGWNVIIGAGNNDDDYCFQVRYFGSINSTNNIISIDLGSDNIILQRWDDTVWHHLIISKAEGVWVDGEKQGNFSPSNKIIEGEFYINGIGYNVSGSVGIRRNANGTFGMFKIDDVIIIPTADGFQNVNTGELLEVVQNGGYTFTENLPTYAEGELYKTINVNVPDLNGSYDEGYAQGKTDGINEQKSKLESINITENGTYNKEDGYNHIEVNVIPKINLQKTGLKLGYSKFTEVPECVDFEGITDMGHMFNNCSNLQTIQLIDTSNVTNMEGIFSNCSNLQTIPLLNTSNVTNMTEMFSECRNLQTIPSLDTSKVTGMYNMFHQCSSLVSLPALNAQSLHMPSYLGIFGYSDLPNLTDFGGFINLKQSLIDYSLIMLPNLTYESCINVLNGLYDFTGNGETPNSEQGKLKVHQNFLDKVGDEISISTLKGWSITTG